MPHWLLLLLLSISLPQIVYEKQPGKNLKGAGASRRHAAFAVSPALICRNGDKVTDLLHVLARRRPLLCNIWYFPFVPVALFSAPPMCDAIAVWGDCFFFLVRSLISLAVITSDVRGRGGGVTSTYCAGCAEPSVRLHINVAATPALVAHFRVITRRIQTAPPRPK